MKQNFRTIEPRLLYTSGQTWYADFALLSLCLIIDATWHPILQNHPCNLVYNAFNLISFDIPLLSINLCLPCQAVYKEKPAAAGFEPRTFQLSGNYADHQGPFTGKTIIEIKFWLEQLFVKKTLKLRRSFDAKTSSNEGISEKKNQSWKLNG